MQLKDGILLVSESVHVNDSVAFPGSAQFTILFTVYSTVLLQDMKQTWENYSTYILSGLYFPL